MKNTQYEEEYDNLFNADNRNPESLEMSAKELDETIKGKHMMDDFSYILSWFNNNWITLKEFERLRGIYGNF
jgi:hypothetical protein